MTPTGLVQRVTTKYFLDYVLPPLPSGLTADDMLSTIRRYGKKSQRLITRRSRWRGFPLDPVFDTRDKQSLFVHLAVVIDAISRAAAAAGHVSTTKLVQHLVEPTQGVKDTTLPNGCMVSRDSDGEAWEDVAAFGWYSKSAECADSFEVSLCSYCLICTNCARRLFDGSEEALRMA